MSVSNLLSNFISSFRSDRFKAPEGVTIHVDPSSDHDDVEGERLSSIDAGDGATFTIEYFGPDGSVSTRTITLHELVRGSQCIYLDAYCHSSDRNRSFRVDRIRTIYDLDGTKHNDPAKYIAELLMLDADTLGKAIEKYANEEKPHLARAMVRDEVKVLMAIARADGFLHDKESNLINKYLKQRLKKERLNLSNDELKKLLYYVRNVNPTDKLVSEALERIDGNADLMRPLIRACRDVVKADGVIDEREEQALQEIEQALGR